MRGTCIYKWLRQTQLGIIPAYAGNMRTGLADGKMHQGSSPRMRGTSILTSMRSSHRGIIPAYAGNIAARTTLCMSLWDHPRVCGEHFICIFLELPNLGSSPRMRGTLPSLTAFAIENGIIPAYAGNICGTSTQSGKSRDHPRVCGEHTTLNAPAHSYIGSSPRMRGTYRHQRPQLTVPRIIPAYAGNIATCGARCRVVRDHPRVCGEHALLCGHCTMDRGSSPRMRGTCLLGNSIYKVNGIIPAYAGNM